MPKLLVVAVFSLMATASSHDQHTMMRRSMIATTSAGPQDPAFVAAVIENRVPFVLRSRTSHLCVDDGGGITPGSTTFKMGTCGDALVDQTFIYDGTTQQLKSTNKPGLCVDDGSSYSPDNAKIQLRECDAFNRHQQFLVDTGTGQVISSSQIDLCLDDGGAMIAKTTAMFLSPCSALDVRHAFEFVPAASLASEGAETFYASGVPVPELFQLGKHFMISAGTKSDLCLSDGGQLVSGHTTFEMATCGTNPSTEVFTYDLEHQQIRSVSKAGLCVNDGCGSDSIVPFLHLQQCNPANSNQQFIFDEGRGQLTNPNSPALCLSDGGGHMPGLTKVYLDWCDEHSDDQRFVLIEVPNATPAAMTAVRPGA